MRGAAIVLVALLLGCADYGLDDRPFRCMTPADCGDGESCAEDGRCRRAPDGGPGPDAPLLPDAGPEADAGAEHCTNATDDNGNGLIDCQDPQCGVAACADPDLCTADTCAPSGACEHTPVLENGSCGPGCVCQNNLPTEVFCTNGLDDDKDGVRDCLDSSDCTCPDSMNCCSTGLCALDCS